MFVTLHNNARPLVKSHVCVVRRVFRRNSDIMWPHSGRQREPSYLTVPLGLSSSLLVQAFTLHPDDATLPPAAGMCYKNIFMRRKPTNFDRTAFWTFSFVFMVVILAFTRRKKKIRSNVTHSILTRVLMSSLVLFSGWIFS